jgi:uncharacterized protein (TIGR02265 family)
MAKVKGTMILGLVKTIRADTGNTYDPHLTDQDRALVARQILPSSWYPFDQFKRIFNTVMEVLVGSNTELVRTIGRSYGRDIVHSVYKNLVIEGDPMESLKKNQIAFKMFFDFGESSFERLSDHSGRVTIAGFDPSFERFYYILAGWLEECLELSGAKNVNSTFTSRSWEGDPDTVVEFSWTAPPSATGP